MLTELRRDLNSSIATTRQGERQQLRLQTTEQQFARQLDNLSSLRVLWKTHSRDYRETRSNYANQISFIFDYQILCNFIVHNSQSTLIPIEYKLKLNHNSAMRQL